MRDNQKFKPGRAERRGFVGGGSTQELLSSALWNGYNSNLTPQLGYNIVPPDFPLQQLVGTSAMASLRHQLQFSADRHGRHQAPPYTFWFSVRFTDLTANFAEAFPVSLLKSFNISQRMLLKRPTSPT